MRFDLFAKRGLQLALAAAASVAVVAACSGGTSPTGPANSTVTTVTITAAGVSPKEVRVGVGAQVRFMNNDTVNRQINSNPFPAHDDCPPINEVGMLTPGQSRMTGALSLRGACGFHEHLTEGAPEFLGRILVGGADPDDEPPDGY